VRTGGRTYRTARTLFLGEAEKEKILSRFSPEAHMRQVLQFAQEHGFHTFTEPFAGIWAPESFSFPWPGNATIEIEDRWHFGDAQEYLTGACISSIIISRKAASRTSRSSAQCCMTTRIA
jgi:hypothetical protein